MVDRRREREILRDLRNDHDADGGDVVNYLNEDGHAKAFHGTAEGPGVVPKGVWADKTGKDYLTDAALSAVAYTHGEAVDVAEQRLFTLFIDFDPDALGEPDAEGAVSIVLEGADTEVLDEVQWRPLACIDGVITTVTTRPGYPLLGSRVITPSEYVTNPPVVDPISFYVPFDVTGPLYVRAGFLLIGGGNAPTLNVRYTLAR